MTKAQSVQPFIHDPIACLYKPLQPLPLIQFFSSTIDPWASRSSPVMVVIRNRVPIPFKKHAFMFVYKSLPYSSTLGSSEPRNLVWLDWLVSPLLEFILVEQTY